MSIAVFALSVSAFGQAGISKMTVLGNFTKYNNRMYAGIWGYVGPDRREYALVTVMNSGGGVSVVEITDPKNPVERGFVSSPNGFNHEVKAYKHYMYKCADQGSVGLQIVDLSGLPTGVRELTPYKEGNVTRCHTLWIDSTHTPALLYMQQATGTDGVVILSLADPTKPVELSRVQVACHDMYAKGNRLYVSGGGSWSIWDVTNASAPKRLSQVQLQTVASSLGETVGISHNVWTTDDGRYAFTSQETIGATVKSWDISNESSPKFLSTYLHDPKVIAHNVMIIGHLMYVAHYLSGLRVVDIRDPRNMKEVAYHKPNGGTTTNGMGGSWGAYCWFPSGVAIHADGCMGSNNVSGLWIVDPDSSIKNTGGSTSLPKGRPASELSIASLDSREIRFHLPRSGDYLLSILDLSGKEAFRTGSKGVEGRQSLALNRRLPVGHYLLSLRQDARISSARIAIQNH